MARTSTQTVGVRDRQFAAWLKEHLKQRDIRETEVATWLNMNVSNVSRRLKGLTPFRRDEIELLDEKIEAHGAVMLQAGYLPDIAYIPRSRYLDKDWFIEQIDELSDLFNFSPIQTAEKRVSRLLAYLNSLHEDSLVRKYRIWLTVDYIEAAAYNHGISEIYIKKARDLRHDVYATRDKNLSVITNRF